MISISTAFSVLLIGLLGSTHCVGMCGGIVGALTMGLPESVSRTPAKLFPYLMLYNLGRISSYALAGALLGFLGGSVLSIGESHTAILVSRWVAAFFVLAMGLYLLGVPQLLLPVEHAGARLWVLIKPLGSRFLPVRSPRHALGLGLVWGWLPCGLVYSVLALAIALGDPVKGALVMVVFGLGTLPMLLFLGGFASSIRALINRTWVRISAGLLVCSVGVMIVVTNVLFGADPEALYNSSFCRVPFGLN
ncbi:MAG TPA: hypothetical protein DCZ12_04855 [Gammaproteobacteria bacterium]|nr:hypothetical protein [Gammaproteobacteria bacterium]